MAGLMDDDCLMDLETMSSAQVGRTRVFHARRAHMHAAHVRTMRVSHSRARICPRKMPAHTFCTRAHDAFVTLACAHLSSQNACTHAERICMLHTCARHVCHTCVRICPRKVPADSLHPHQRRHSAQNKCCAFGRNLAAQRGDHTAQEKKPHGLKGETTQP